MLNPFVSRVASTGELYNGIANNWMIYRSLPGMDPDPNATVASRMRASNGQPIYKSADISTPSNSLPRGWLTRPGNSALVRSASFNCVDQNEPQVRSYLLSQQGVPGVVGQRGGPPPSQIVPSGDIPFAGTVQGHKSGTRPAVNSSIQLGTDPDACQISYVPWSTVTHAIDQAGPMSWPGFVAPTICSTSITTGSITTPYSGPECVAPVDWYTKTVRITFAGTLAYVSPIQPACNEECTVGGNVKLCPRPYNRF